MITIPRNHLAHRTVSQLRPIWTHYNAPYFLTTQQIDNLEELDSSVILLADSFFLKLPKKDAYTAFSKFEATCRAYEALLVEYMSNYLIWRVIPCNEHELLHDLDQLHYLMTVAPYTTEHFVDNFYALLEAFAIDTNIDFETIKRFV